ncbi:iron-siderophore ABC transporter substrate-binding protein [Aquamicrobium segne]|uniref:Iron-siderophore ABC transporter substrate-binding protein n=1 Tax=Aquamicrobium segne TaxID=469547 RepID=A0ABW0GXH8_9HYPH
MPASPVRVVALHTIFAEAMLVCGIVPVGTVVHGQAIPRHLKAELRDAVSVGQSSAPDFEAILGLAPDLILATPTAQRDSYPLLQAIAPTVLLEEPGANWREWLRAVGVMTGCQEQSDKAIAAYDKRALEIRERLQASHAGETVLLLRVRDKHIRIYGGARRSGPVLFHDLGLTPHSLVPMAENNLVISNEIIPQLTADHIFLMVEDQARMQGLRDTVLWNALPAIRNGHVYEVDIEPWNQSNGPISFRRIIEDVARNMLGDD